AFDAFVRFNNLENRIKSLKKINTADDPALREVQELIIHGSFPPDLSHAIQEALDRIKSRQGECHIAVRSSAEEEDSSRSFAGQFETILNVPPVLDAVEQACREV